MALELSIGLAVALTLNARFRLRGLVRRSISSFATLRSLRANAMFWNTVMGSRRVVLELAVRHLDVQVFDCDRSVGEALAALPGLEKRLSADPRDTRTRS